MTAAEDVAKEREAGRCRRCGSAGPLSHHHRMKRRHEGADVVPNIVMLCGSGTTGCHGMAHASHTQAQLKAEGYVVPSWEDPAAIPVLAASWLGPVSVTVWLLPDGTIREEYL